ncbi:hypothetical protein AKJ51_04335 [candidate division MSBL1 archaeon SCGC-AAA382A20]|uniref:Uncharacterized protein n=1 Tax=candidate division MSBL1 archaeon SCGC-AAA382A20 TaxID=1698280 RepID=A0A133VHT7_9EURY|nr:hypothetical protein AKJ51_04335 [candidate division MSBL1 archaeon SCGC-AAA382A20]
MISLTRFVKPKKISSREIKESDKTYCHVESESILSKACLILKKSESREIRLLKKITKPSYRQRISSKLNNSENNHYSYNTKMKEFTLQILEDLFTKTEFPVKKIDQLTAYTDTYNVLKTPGDIQKVIEIILNTESSHFDFPKKIHPEKPKIAANELKSKAVSRGARRIISMNSKANYSPSVYLDFSTYLSGLTHRHRKPDKITGLLSGTGMKILNALARGHSEVDSKNGNVLQLPTGRGEIYNNEVEEYVSQVNKLIDIGRVPSGTKRIGGIPVNVSESYKSGVKLIGCEVKGNKSDFENITNIGKKAASYGSATLEKMIEKTYSLILGRLISFLYNESLIEPESKICISGCNTPTKSLIKEVVNELKDMGFEKSAKNLIFIENPEIFGFFKSNFNQ